MLSLKPERFELGDFRSQAVSICGKSFVADQSGALLWPARSTLLVADLDLGRPAAADAALPALPGRAHATLLGLAAVLDRYEPRTVVVLVGEPGGPSPALARRELEILRILQEERDWYWLAPAGEAGQELGGAVLAELELDGIALRPRPRQAPATHEIAGGTRPAACISIYGTPLRRPCFVSNGLRLLLPAFGATTGGSNVLDDGLLRLLGTRGLSVWMLGEEGLYPIAARLLCGD